MNDTKKEKWLLYLMISLAIVFWIGVISGIFNLVFVAIAATVYCILGMQILFLCLGIRETVGRRILYRGIGCVIFSIPVIICFF